MATSHNKDALLLRDRMRSETYEIHENLHRHPSFVALFDGTLTRDGYAALMKRKYGYFAPLDDAVARALQQTGANYDHVYRSRFLRQDVDALTHGAEISEPEQVPSNVFEAVTPDTVGGVLYVIEGSTLGGSRIDRAAQCILGTDSVAGRRYWAWCRAENRTRWARIMEFLAHQGKAGQSVDHLIEGAHWAFSTLENWLAPLDASARAEAPAAT